MPYTVFQAVVEDKLCYVVPAWNGLTKAAEQERLDTRLCVPSSTNVAFTQWLTSLSSNELTLGKTVTAEGIYADYLQRASLVRSHKFRLYRRMRVNSGKKKREISWFACDESF